MGIPQAASVGKEGALAQGPCDAFSSSLPPLCTPWAGKKPKSPPGPLSSVDATLSACPSPGPLSSANVILSACPPPGPCSDDGRIHVRFDGPGKCLGDATILVYTLPQWGRSLHTLLFLPSFPTTSASDGPHLCAPGSPYTNPCMSPAGGPCSASHAVHSALSALSPFCRPLLVFLRE